MKTLGELFLLSQYHHNPVTRSVYKQMVANRLDRLEKRKNIKGAIDDFR
jgi:hypothetical protein